MQRFNFSRHSLKTRVIVTTLAVVLLGGWLLAFYVGSLLQRDMKQLLSDQQFSMASLLAREVDRELLLRQDDLMASAVLAGKYLSLGPGLAQQFLDERPTLSSLFNGGLVLLDKAGTVIAELPLVANRRGVNYQDYPVIQRALGDGVASIATPRVGKHSGQPVVWMAAPIYGEDGSIRGVLAGIINLSQANFLSHIINSSYGQTGGFVLIDAASRVVITATDKRRTLEQLPPVGVNPAIDHFLSGHDGSAVMVNPHGVEVLVSDKQVPAADWVFAATIPTEEAFAPLRAMARRVALATLGLTLVLGLVIWLLLRRQFKPLEAHVKKLTAMADPSQSLSPLPVTEDDEIGQLAAAFNRLVGTLDERETALRTAEKKFRLLVEHSLVGIYIIDNGRFAYVNPRFAEMFGYASTQAVLNHATVSDLVAPQDRDLVVGNLQKRMAGEQTTISYAFTGLRRDGSLFDVEVMGSVMTLETHPVVIGMVLDVTQRKQAERLLKNHQTVLEQTVLERTRELAAARDQAESASRAKSAFLAGMSHELRTPLNHITGFAALLKREIASERGQAWLSSLSGAAKTLLHLINDILDYSQIEGGELVIEDAAYDLAALLQQVESEFAPVAQGKGLALALVVDPALPQQLSGDRLRLMQIIGHLLSNAIKFSEHGQVTVSVQAMAGAGQQKMVRFAVTDQGVGIAEAEQAGLFVLFHQLDDSLSRQFAGTGLGLALCQRLVGLMAGEIGFTSQPGQGSTFWFAVPLREATSVAL